MDHETSFGNHTGLATEGANKTLHFVKRGDDVFVPLVAVDQLPYWLEVGGLRPKFSGSDLLKCNGIVVADRGFEGELEIEIHDLDRRQVTMGYETAQTDSTDPIAPRIFSHSELALKRDHTLQRYQPTTPGVLGGKKFCTHWIRTGQCDFMQQGCMFIHRIPDKKTLELLGFMSYPRWFREMPLEFQEAHYQQGPDSQVQRGPVRRTRNMRGTPHGDLKSRAEASNGYAASQPLSSWPYPAKKPHPQAKHESRRPHSRVDYAQEPEKNAKTYSSEPNEARGNYRSYEYAPLADPYSGDVEANDRSPSKSDRVAREKNTPHDPPRYPLNEYVATPRAYMESSQESPPSKETLNEIEDQQQPTQQPAEDDTFEIDMSTPPNFAGSSTPDLVPHQVDDLSDDRQATFGGQNGKVEQVHSSQNHNGHLPNTRGRYSKHHHRAQPSRQDGEDHRPSRPYRGRNNHFRRGGRNKELPRLKYPPQSRHEHNSGSSSNRRHEPRVWSNGDRGNADETEDLIIFD